MRSSARSILCALVFCVVLIPAKGSAQDATAPADKTLSPYFFIEGGDPAIDRVPLKDTLALTYRRRFRFSLALCGFRLQPEGERR